MIPSHEEIKSAFGFRPPPSYEQLLRKAHSIAPDDPWNACDPIGLRDLDSYGSSIFDYAVNTPAEFFIFGWTGGDGGHYGFVIDDIRDDFIELPIAENSYCGSQTRLLANSIEQFLTSLASEACKPIAPGGLNMALLKEVGIIPECTYVPEPSPECDDERMEEVERLRIELAPELQFEAECDPDEIAERTWIDRLAAGAYPTLDRIGMIVPSDTTDHGLLASIAWEDLHDSAHRGRIEGIATLLDRADRLLDGGNVGTAMIIARNLRFRHWYDDWKGERTFLSRTSDLLVRGYRMLNREWAAERVRLQTEHARRTMD